MRKCLVLVVTFLVISQFVSSPSNAAVEDKCLFLKNRGYVEFNQKLINTDGPFTVEFWTNQIWKIPYVTEIISQGSQPFAFYVGPTSEGVYRAGDSWPDTRVKAELNQWTHIAVSRSTSGVGNFYINGALISSNSSYKTQTGVFNTRLGAQFGPWGGEEYAGCVDELRIWNYERSASQIGQNVAKESIKSEPGLLYWSFNQSDIDFVASDLRFPIDVKYQIVGIPELTEVTESGFDLKSLSKERPKLIHYPICEVSITPPCIEDVTLYSPSGAIIKAIPVQPSIDVHAFASITSDSVPIYRWRTPGIFHEDGGDIIDVNVFRFPLGANYCWAVDACASDVDEIVIQVYGASKGRPNKVIEFPDLADNRVCGTTQLAIECTRPWGLNLDYRYEVRLRVERDFEISHSNGEARDGSLVVSRLEDGSERLTFSGYPVTFSYVIESVLRPRKTEDRADVSYNYIGVYAHSVKSAQSQWLSRCDYGRGLSLWYSGYLQSMPTWLADESALTLRVSSPHLRADGSKNLGTFNIEMPISTAQCLWGVDLSKAAKAVVSTLYPEASDVEVITTSATVDGSVYRISADGFHFSTPTIKVKVEQEKLDHQAQPSQISSTESSSVVSAPINVIKKKAILCAKGMKRVKAKSGICPKGYKRVVNRS